MGQGERRRARAAAVPPDRGVPRRPVDFADVVRQGAAWVERANRRRHARLRARPIDLWQEERAHLLALPRLPFDTDEVGRRPPPRMADAGDTTRHLAGIVLLHHPLRRRCRRVPSASLSAGTFGSAGVPGGHSSGCHGGVRDREPAVREHAPEQEAEGDRADERNGRPGPQVPNHVPTIVGKKEEPRR